MKEELSQIREALNKLQGQKALYEKQKEDLEIVKTQKELLYERCLKAREIVTIVAKNTQQKIEYRISNLVSYALAAVFPDPWSFSLRFVTRRNKAEADLIFSKGGNKKDRKRETADILNSGGGGAADIAALALRIAMWAIRKNSPVMILDEPTKYLHNPLYQEKASEMVKEVSKETGLQIIMVTDQEAMIKAADKEIRVLNNKGVSFVEVAK